MKKRAKDVGERGLHPLLRAMQQASPAVRIHLMGHSFGCIVASAAIAGPSGAAPLPFPINSCVLVQGAMSIWSFTSSLPTSHETAGFFNNILVDKKISGPFVATRSDSDMAVGKLYPWAAGVAGQVAYMFPRSMPQLARWAFVAYPPFTILPYCQVPAPMPSFQLTFIT